MPRILRCRSGVHCGTSAGYVVDDAVDVVQEAAGQIMERMLYGVFTID